MVPRVTVEGIFQTCMPDKTKNKYALKVMMQLWISVYFFVPAAIIVTLNGAIVWRLKVSWSRSLFEGSW